MSKHKCKNPHCPNGGKINVMAFRGTGFCSVSCKKKMGDDLSSVGTIMFVTSREREIIKARRDPQR